MIEAVDSFYRSVKSRIITLNPNRIVVGMMDAMDWPPKEIQMEAFYLVTLADSVVSKAYSPYAMGLSHAVQWIWIIAGTDLTTGVKGRNRGDRFRKGWAMKAELMNGLYPYFCEKKSWSAKQVGNSVVTESQPLDPVESITWSPPAFMTKVDKKGLIYGSAQVHITSMSDAVTS